MKGKTINDRPPNFRDDKGRLFLVRCYACNKEYGTENYAMCVSSGVCAFCGWEEVKWEEKVDRKKRGKTSTAI